MEFINDGGEAEETKTPPPKRPNAAQAIEEIKLKFVEGFGANAMQKTQITPRERQLLSMLYPMAGNLFPVSSKVKIGADKKCKIHTSECLKNVLDTYIVLGIPVGRKGREEEERVLASMFGGDPMNEMEPVKKKNRLLG